jgi:biotin synthase
VNKILETLKFPHPSTDAIASLLSSEDEFQRKELFETSETIKSQMVGNIVYLRGLIEMSNVCRKNCYYCGIRGENSHVIRYSLTDEEILTAAHYAHNNGLGSIVLQGGENISPNFVERIEVLVKTIKKETNNELGITLSLGEQKEDTYARWREAGAHRYLLRIESSNPELYGKLHPADSYHSFENRLKCLKVLKKLDYQVGTGVMIGLPFQTYTDLANDILFMYDFDIDMCGMGPYIEHAQTPLYQYRDMLLSIERRLDLTLRMIAVLRILMPRINIVATTALQAIDPTGREKAIKIGANVLMPNITPPKYRKNYLLYENKPCTDEDSDDCISCLETRISLINHKIGKGQWGDSLHYFEKKELLKNSENRENG